MILPTQRTLSQSLFFYSETNNGEGVGGVEGSTVEGYMLSLTKNSHHQSPAQTLYFLTYYTATKSSFTLPEITIGQDKIHGWSAHSALGPC